MKVALVHEFLTQYGGAERVLEALAEMFPNAPIYTLVYNQKNMSKYFSKYNIKTSFLQNTLFAKTKLRWYLPWMPAATESFDLSSYDLVISDASAFAKGVITTIDTTHICYCHTPTRYLWEDTFEYIKNSKIPWPVSIFSPYIISNLRKWDYLAAQRPDYLIANSKYVQKRIKKYYRRESEVVYPFVYSDKFTLDKQKDDYYIVAGRMAPYKRYDLAIQAFNQMPEKKLIIVGDGVASGYLQKLATSANIKFLGRVSDQKLASLYAKAKAYIFTAQEDFGITPLEAMSCGTPVIAYAKGGALETVTHQTGIFFHHQNVSDLIKAIKKFEKTKFDYKKISEHAKKFEKKVFQNNIKKIINKTIKQ